MEHMTTLQLMHGGKRSLNDIATEEGPMTDVDLAVLLGDGPEMTSWPPHLE